MSNTSTTTLVEIEIDGAKVEVPQGSMVMHAANKADIYVPHFCYHKKLSIAANCRMCLVEVEKAPKPLPACATPVTPGMVVRTKSDKAIAAQKGVMEFLLINHPLDCPICDQGGECQLQDLAVGYGGSSSRYSEEKRVVFHKNVGPLISMEEMSRCIHCTRCVRFGQEIAGVMELGMLNRGEHSEITTFVGKTVDSELSGNMIDICPVGALTSKPFRYQARTWELARRKSVSPHDALGANLVVQVKKDEVLRVVPLENEAINECWISDKDRFSYEALNSEARLTRPMLKQGGQWLETDWQTALEYVANGLTQIKQDHGAEAIAALATPHSTTEELYLLQKLMRGFGVEQVETRLRYSDFEQDKQRAGIPWLGMKIAEVSTLDRALIIGSFLRKDHPVLSARIRQAAKGGLKINVLHAVDEDWLMPIANKAVVAPSLWHAALNQIAIEIAAAKGIAAPVEATVIDAATQEVVKSIAASLLSGERKAVFLGNAAVQHPQASKLAATAQWIASETGATFGVLTEAANSVGAYVVNAMMTKAESLYQGKKAYLLFNAEPELDCYDAAQVRLAMQQAEMVVQFSAFKTTAMDYADVLLPVAPFTETPGTFINAEGTVQSFNAVVRPRGESRPGWKVLRVLGNMLNIADFEYETAEAVRTEALPGSDWSGKLSNQIHAVLSPAQSSHSLALERIAPVPIYSADAVVRRAASLQATTDGKTPAVTIHPQLLERLGLHVGDEVRVKQGAAQALLKVNTDTRLPANVVRVPAGHPVTATLGPMFGELVLERV
jgi:NADH-quinone oxidoreductase subunit G